MVDKPVLKKADFESDQAVDGVQGVEIMQFLPKLRKFFLK